MQNTALIVSNEQKNDEIITFLSVPAETLIQQYEYSFLSIEDALALRQQIILQPTFVSTCYIIRFDRCSDEAQNALLKLLEETPQNVSIALVIPHKELLLPTVQSRLIIATLKTTEDTFDKLSFADNIQTRWNALQNYSKKTSSQELAHIVITALNNYEQELVASISPDNATTIHEKLQIIKGFRIQLQHSSAPHKMIAELAILTV